MMLAQREYDLEGRNEKILLQIYEPIFSDGNWVCVYQIISPLSTHTETYRIYGVDKLQSISLALKHIKANLHYISEATDSKILLLGESRLDLI
jgi:hypothetical protein